MIYLRLHFVCIQTNTRIGRTQILHLVLDEGSFRSEEQNTRIFMQFGNVIKSIKRLGENVTKYDFKCIANDFVIVLYLTFLFPYPKTSLSAHAVVMEKTLRLFCHSLIIVENVRVLHFSI